MRYRQTVLGDRPVAHWPLGDRSGTAARELVAARNGTYQASPTLGAAPLLSEPGVVPRFTAASSQYVSVADSDVFSSQVSGDITIEVWVYVVAVPPVFLGLVTKGTTSNFEWGVQLHGDVSAPNNDNSVMFVIWSTSGGELWVARSGVNSIAAGGLYHIVGTYSSTGNPISVFLNGVQHVGAAGSGIGSKGNGTAPVTFGVRGDLAGSYFDGLIGHVAYYDRVLSPATVRHHYAVGRGLIAPRHLLIPVPAVSAQTLRPDGDVTVGSWQNELGGTTNLYQSIDETPPHRLRVT